MRTRVFTSVLALLASAACSASAATTARDPALSGPDELVYVATADGPAVVDMRNGRTVFRAEGAVPQADWSALFTTTADAGGTALRTLDPASGRVTGDVPLRGSLSIRAVADDGTKVALMAPPPPGTDPWTPVPRSRTTIVVADPSGTTGPETYHLRGNLEPEAFSNDGEHLFVIQYLPPQAPSLYRVSELELEDGDVYPVVGRKKTWTRRMPGIRLEQLLSPDQRQLYTLYSSQPATYAEGYDDPQATSGGPVAFVHILNLQDRWAFCLPLPRRLWGAPAGEQAMASSSDGSRLFVVDPSRDTVAVIDAESTEVKETATVDFGTQDRTHAAAAVSPDGSTLYVGTGDAVVALDAATLSVRFRWPMRTPVASLSTSVDGALLYVAHVDGIGLLDPSTGTVQGSIPIVATTIQHVASAT